jgi:hypothetical protein
MDAANIVTEPLKVKLPGDLAASRALSVSDAEQLEQIAQEIECIQSTAVLHIAARAAKAHELFRYRRDEGGYAGWMKDRLGHSRSNAYRLLDVHRRFGNGESFPNLGTLSVSAIYLLAVLRLPGKLSTKSPRASRPARSRPAPW